MNSLSEIWNSVMDILRQRTTATAINTWFSDCEPVDLAEKCLVLKTTSEFKRNIIEDRFAPEIREILSDLFSCEFDFKLLLGDELEEYETAQKGNHLMPEMDGYTFDNFIVGSSNKFAHAAALSVAMEPGKNYNPLLIYGNSGLGKTHLLLAIGQYINEHQPHAQIAYIKGDEFTNQMVNSIQTGRAEEFRQKYRNVDLFLVDDIQFIAGKESTQEEFFHTFNNIYEAGHQIVITSDRPPVEMTTLDDRLRTRFEGGLIADVQSPDLETRIAITRNKAALLGMILPNDIVNFIAENLTSNIRQIEGVVKRLTAYSNVMHDDITIDHVRRAIKDVVRVGVYIPTPDVIIEETARYFNLKPEDLKGQRRSKNTALARQVSMYLMRQLTNMSFKDIGTQYENRNHATVMASVNKIQGLIETDKSVASTIRDITSNINSKNGTIQFEF